MSLTLDIVCVALLAVLVTSQQSTDNCPPSLTRNEYLEAYNGACYQFVLYRERDYVDAESDCESHGGTLALAKTSDVQAYLQSRIISHGVYDTVWIGLNDIVKENSFVWEDGTALDDSQSHWADGSGPRPGAIQHRLEDCVAMDTNRNGVWVDYHCQNELFGLLTYEKKYVCQYKLSVSGTTGPPKITIGVTIG